ncbi:MAG: hypothetical protein Q8R13_05110 [bacterium]|nr:hypothetical protein [bacterium]MDZ4296252.1 hypothetical protein [Patescibacteria group bacterium]
MFKVTVLALMLVLGLASGPDRLVANEAEDQEFQRRLQQLPPEKQAEVLEAIKKVTERRLALRNLLDRVAQASAELDDFEAKRGDLTPEDRATITRIRGEIKDLIAELYPIAHGNPGFLFGNPRFEHINHMLHVVNAELVELRGAYADAPAPLK